MNRDMALGLIVMAVAGLYIRAAAGIPVSFLGDAIGAGGVPFVLGVVLTAAGAALVLQAFLVRRRGRTVPGAAADGEEGEEAGAFADPHHAVLKAGGVVLLAVLFLVVLRPLGYIPAMALLIAAMLLYQGVALRPATLLVAVLGALGLWAMFDLGLGIDLPDGTLLSRLF